MRNSISELLNLTLKKRHEQSTALCDYVVLVSNISERVLERGTCKTVYGVYNDFKRLSKSISHIFIKIRFKSSSEKSPCSIEVPMLDSHSSINNILEYLSKLRTKQAFKYNAMWMHGRYVSIPYINVHTRLRIYFTAFSYFFSKIC